MFSRYLMLHLLAMLLVIIALCMGVKMGLDIYTHHGEGVDVPDLKGVDFNRAVALLSQKELLIAVTDSGYNKQMHVNSILTQSPGAGTNVKKGRTIQVTINAATLPSITIPDLIDNSSYREAQARLTALGFKMREPKRIDGERDWVYGIMSKGRSLQAGDKMPIESELELIIGNGHEDEGDDINMMLDAPEPTAGDEVDEFEEVTGTVE